MKMKTTTIHALLLATLCGAAGSAHAQAVATIAVSDKPMRIIRGAAVYKAPAGTIVQKDDIVETAAGSAQIEAGPDAIIALGPETRLYVAGLATDGKATEVQLLQGWVKLASKGGARPGVTTASLQASFASGAVIASSKPAKVALFADEGELLVARVDEKGKPGAPVKVPAEQFAFALAGQPLVVQARPAKDFLAEMPPQFRDRLAPVAASSRPPRAPAVKEREAEFADVAAWLGSSLPARKGFVARFKARLKDAAFRKQLEQSGPGPDWTAVLAPAAPAKAADKPQDKPQDKPAAPRNDNPIY